MFFPWQDLSASRRLTSFFEHGGGFPLPVMMYVCVCVGRREGRKMVVILTYGLDSGFLLGRGEKNGYTEECRFSERRG